jgi:addiction module RelE/StbE family toxin
LVKKERSMKVEFHKAFAKQLGKHPTKVQLAFQKRLEIFLSEQFNETLSNHNLSGKWSGYRSINISGDLRAIYKLKDKDTAYFIAFGTHSQLYK